MHLGRQDGLPVLMLSLERTAEGREQTPKVQSGWQVASHLIDVVKSSFFVDCSLAQKFGLS